MVSEVVFNARQAAKMKDDDLQTTNQTSSEPRSSNEAATPSLGEAFKCSGYKRYFSAQLKRTKI